LTDKYEGQPPEKSTERRGKNNKGSSAKKQRSSKGGKKKRESKVSESSFEREDGEQNIDNIISNIIEGDDTLKKDDKLKLTHETQQSNPFDVVKQSSVESGNDDIDRIISKAVVSEDGSPRTSDKARELSPASSEEEVNRPAAQLPTGLESDLETILETDQESNYMTTARTLAQNQTILTLKANAQAS